MIRYGKWIPFEPGREKKRDALHAMELKEADIHDPI